MPTLPAESGRHQNEKSRRNSLRHGWFCPQPAEGWGPPCRIFIVSPLVMKEWRRKEEAVTRARNNNAWNFAEERNHAWKIAEKPKLRTEEQRKEEEQEREEPEERRRCKTRQDWLTTKYDRVGQWSVVVRCSPYLAKALQLQWSDNYFTGTIDTLATLMSK